MRVLVRDIDITDFVESVVNEGHSEKPNRALILTLKNTINGRTKAFAINNSEVVQFYDGTVRIFVGVVFNTVINESGDMTVTCYDRNYYTLKSTTSRQFKNKKASDIIKQLATDFGIPVGTIEDTGFVIPTLILRNHSLYDMMLKALVITKKQTGKRFFFGSENGKLTIKQHKNNVTPWILAAGSNLISASYSVSIEDTKTQVQVTGGKDNKFTHTVKSANTQKLYGIMQHYEEMDEKSTSSQVKQRAETLLKEMAVINDQADVSAIGINGVVTGCGVYIREPMTGLAGGYYVTSDSHTYASSGHTMQLEISKSLEMPTIEISDEELGIDDKQ
ncbi:XkdQ/YqbQ family protein [Paenisporosarcina sp. NPDC076898]|uniref:XkdQ/YqbQ family protein n=1 Tax=unclassified Paenisporosarcina TaxID=2642018 RepID=UPI003CFFAFA1